MGRGGGGCCRDQEGGREEKKRRKKSPPCPFSPLSPPPLSPNPLIPFSCAVPAARPPCPPAPPPRCLLMVYMCLKVELISGPSSRSMPAKDPPSRLSPLPSPLPALCSLLLLLPCGRSCRGSGGAGWRDDNQSNHAIHIDSIVRGPKLLCAQSYITSAFLAARAQIIILILLLFFFFHTKKPKEKPDIGPTPSSTRPNHILPSHRDRRHGRRRRRVLRRRLLLRQGGGHPHHGHRHRHGRLLLPLPLPLQRCLRLLRLPAPKPP